jgi:hypothetical protein
LAQSHIGDPAHDGLEENDVFVGNFDDHVIKSALAHNLQRFIDDEALAVQARLDYDHGARLGGSDGGGDRGVISPVQLVDDQLR